MFPPKKSITKAKQPEKVKPTTHKKKTIVDKATDFGHMALGLPPIKHIPPTRTSGEYEPDPIPLPSPKPKPKSKTYTHNLPE